MRKETLVLNVMEVKLCEYDSQEKINSERKRAGCKQCDDVGIKKVIKVCV